MANVDTYPFLAFSDQICTLVIQELGFSGFTVLSYGRVTEFGSSNRGASPSAGQKILGLF